MANIEKFNELVSKLPDYKELARRAALFAAIDNSIGYAQDNGIVKNYNKNNSDRYFWEDGGGQEANIIFKADGINDDSILIFGYDHESYFNAYAAEKGEKYSTVIAFDELPEEFNHLINEDYLKWSWDTSTDDKKVQATCAIWQRHGISEWNASSTFLKAMTDEKDDGGFNYCFEKFTLEPTLENIKSYYVDHGHEDSELLEIEKIYNTFYPN